MNSSREEIQFKLKEIVKELDIEKTEPLVEHPADPSHGDYSSNIALVLGKKLNQNPMELAEEIKKRLEVRTESLEFEKIEVAKPGFINFWLSKDYLVGQLEGVIRKKDTYGNGILYHGKKIMVEFTDPNPFKEFHIGHLYSNIVGESLCRLLEANGALVKRVNYQGDVGMHVAKALWGLLQLSHAELGSASPDEILKRVQDDNLEEKVKFIGEAYALGAKAYEEDETAKREINELNKKVYEKDPEIMDLYEKGRQWSLDYFESIYKRLGTKFDFYYFEGRVGKVGLELVGEYLKKPFGKAQGKGVFEKSEGAVIFPGKQSGFHTRVFINSLGLPTYEAKELGLAPTKYEEFPYDQSLIVTGNEIIEYFKVLLAALAKIRPDLAAKTKHIPHGMVRLAKEKMSSRTGKVITGQWLLDEAKAKIKERFGDINDQIAEQVAVGAVKYALLKSSIGKDIAFNFEESISLEGNSGPYLQYTYARTQSVLAKSDKNVIPNSFRDLKKKEEMLKQVQHDNLNVEEISLLRSLHRFPEVVEESAVQFAPNLLCNYLFDLAQKFNLFYQKHPILKGEQSSFRLALTDGVGKILNHGLYLLGIEAPKRM